jgi:hypothetical protein
VLILLRLKCWSSSLHLFVLCLFSIHFLATGMAFLARLSGVLIILVTLQCFCNIAAAEFPSQYGRRNPFTGKVRLTPIPQPTSSHLTHPSTLPKETSPFSTYLLAIPVPTTAQIPPLFPSVPQLALQAGQASKNSISPMV